MSHWSGICRLLQLSAKQSDTPLTPFGGGGFQRLRLMPPTCVTIWDPVWETIWTNLIKKGHFQRYAQGLIRSLFWSSPGPVSGCVLKRGDVLGGGEDLEGFGRPGIQVKLYDLFPESGSDSAGLGYRLSLKLTESEASHALVPSVGGFGCFEKAPGRRFQ